MKMNKHVMVGLSLFFFLSLLAAPAFGEAPKDPDKFKFGFISCITGPAAWLHDLWAPAAEMAVEEINAAGGVFGKPMEVIWEDHKSGDPKAAVSGMIKLADMDKVPFVVVTFTPPNIAVQPIAAEKKILQVNIGAWGPQLIGKPYLFNSRLVASILAEGGAKVAWDKGLRKAAVLHPNDASGVATKNFLITKWKEWGGKIVAVETTDLGASAFHVQLAKIRVSKPDVIFNYFYSMDLGYSLKQARELGINLPVYGLQWNKKLFKASGPACKGFSYVMDYFDPDSQKPWTKKFVAAYKKRSKKGNAPEMYAANAYEITYILKELITEARKKGGNYYTGENLKEALLKIRTFDTIYEDKISFRDDGTCTKTMMLWTATETGEAKMVRKLSLD